MYNRMIPDGDRCPRSPDLGGVILHNVDQYNATKVLGALAPPFYWKRIHSQPWECQFSREGNAAPEELTLR